ncbi:aldehyde dehydrogenase family protein [Geodermatophilus sp. CPCC 206100]|uniref:aldehyde dehydrogenase family protein n=1 Tax=Geodermatophilus sp. CPCC 206100 TaxID=3020054 RepID=UPI003B00C88B
MVIDGAPHVPAGAGVLDVVDPATGDTVAGIPAGTAADVDRAVAAAKAASPGWRATPAAERGRLVGRLADAVAAHGEELAQLDALDNGSPLRMLRNDVRLAVDQVRYFAGLALELRGQSIPAPGGIDFTVFEPFGVVGRLVPFNHPLMFAATKLAAPLVAGNTVVLKPSEHTSLSALRIGELCAEIFPPGVVNVVTGLGSTVGARLTSHPDVPRIAFTGSVETGLHIQRQAAADRVKVVTLELGGKNPLIVFADADLDAAVAGAVHGMNFTWQGQSCGSTSRAYVHRSVWDRFLAGVEARLGGLRVGDPFDETTDVGAIVHRGQYDRVSRYVEAGLDDPRARLVVGGSRRDEKGLFIEPTVFAFDGGPCDSVLLTEEVFGPVLAVVPFDDHEEVVALANALPLGLTASVWTSSLDTAMRATSELEAGYVWVNASSVHIPGTPFGGVKNSGVGREEGVEELTSYAQQKNVYIRVEGK